MKIILIGRLVVLLLLLMSNFSAYAGQKTHWQRFGNEYVKIKYDPSHTKQCGNNFTGTIVSFPGGDGTYKEVPAKTQNGEIVTSIRTGRLCYRYYQVSFASWEPGNVDAGGYYSNHRDTPKKAAVFVTQIISFIKNSGLNRGKKLIYVGSSAGTVVGAAALDHNADHDSKTFTSLVDRAIFVSGPVGNYNNACKHIKGSTQSSIDNATRSDKCTNNSGNNSFNRYENVVDRQKTFWNRGYLRNKTTNINIILGKWDTQVTKCDVGEAPGPGKTCRWPNMSFAVHDYLFHVFHPTRSSSRAVCNKNNFPDEGLYDWDNRKYVTCVSIPGTHDLWENYQQRALENNTSKLVCKYAAIEGNLSRASRDTCKI